MAHWRQACGHQVRVYIWPLMLDAPEWLVRDGRWLRLWHYGRMSRLIRMQVSGCVPGGKCPSIRPEHVCTI